MMMLKKFADIRREPYVQALALQLQEDTIEGIIPFIKNGQLSVKDAAKILNVSPEEFTGFVRDVFEIDLSENE